MPPLRRGPPLPDPADRQGRLARTRMPGARGGLSEQVTPVTPPPSYERALAAPSRVLVPACRIERTTATSLTSSVTTFIEFNSEVFDDANYHSTSTNPRRLTLPSAGLYSIQVWGKFDTIGSGYCYLDLLKSGALFVSERRPPTGNHVEVTAFAEIRGVAGEYIEARAQQNSGVTTTILANDGGHPNPFMTILRLSN